MRDNELNSLMLRHGDKPPIITHRGVCKALRKYVEEVDDDDEDAERWREYERVADGDCDEEREQQGDDRTEHVEIPVGCRLDACIMSVHSIRGCVQNLRVPSEAFSIFCANNCMHRKLRTMVATH